jgi:DNA helicase-2/ATP-dependent DNA helicase PcrA
VIYDSSDQLSVVKQAMKALGWTTNTSSRARRCRASARRRTAWNPPSRCAGPVGILGTSRSRAIYDAYLKTLKDAGALDFDDLLLKTVELFDTSERVRTFYAHKFRYVMVDEYQDTNRPQYLLIRHWPEHYRNLCVVGDPDQSIYKWRGADLRNILDFERDFGETHIVKLEQNYRSTQVILDAASAVIGRNRNRKDKKLWTDKQGRRAHHVRPRR